MPSRRLTRPDDPLYKVEIVVVHHAYELYPTVGWEVRLEFVSGERYTVLHKEIADDQIPFLPSHVSEVVEEFLFGDQAKGVVASVRKFDQGKQSKRVRLDVEARKTE